MKREHHSKRIIEAWNRFYAGSKGRIYEIEGERARGEGEHLHMPAGRGRAPYEGPRANCPYCHDERRR